MTVAEKGMVQRAFATGTDMFSFEPNVSSAVSTCSDFSSPPFFNSFEYCSELLEDCYGNFHDKVQHVSLDVLVDPDVLLCSPLSRKISEWCTLLESDNDRD